MNGVPVPNPQGTTFSETRVGATGTFEVPGAAGAFQTFDKNIPHGAVSEVDYWSTSLGMQRRAHLYTPPGYTKGGGSYPVLYLVHGAGDSDDSWTSIGHAHYVLDNLIAAGKAKPMIIVMPFGHTPDRPGANMLANTDFADDLLKELIPYVEANYRTIDKSDLTRDGGAVDGWRAHAAHGAAASGAVRLHRHLQHGAHDADAAQAEYEAKNGAALDRAAKSRKLVYYAMGKTDFLYATVAPTRAMFDQHGLRHVYHESEGGHTWINWRRYLNDFAPRLFR